MYAMTKDLREIITRGLAGAYQVILADPPWRYGFSRSRQRSVERQYPTMPLKQIKALPVQELSARNAVLYLWATAPKLAEALEVMKAWDFHYKTQAVWDKELMGMGYWFRGQHEILLVGTRGRPGTPDPENRVRSVIRAKRTRHSTKPTAVHQLIEQGFPQARKLELFARQHRPGWDAWGNEL